MAENSPSSNIGPKIVHRAESVYFGCWSDAGHHFWEPNGRDAGSYSEVKALLPWGEIDGALTPKNSTAQGLAALHHAHGWTALAWHDYSVDHRGGSNSVLFHPGVLTFEQMVLHLSLVWTPIYLRQPVPVHLQGSPQVENEQEGTP